MNRLIDEGFTRENLKEFLEDQQDDAVELAESLKSLIEDQSNDFNDCVASLCEGFKSLAEFLSS